MKKIFIILICLISLLLGAIYGYENPERMGLIKMKIKKQFSPKIQLEKGPIQKARANFFNIEFTKVISLTERTAFIVHDINVKKFDANILKIYTQDGYLLKNLKSEKLNLPSFFTKKNKGGVKTVFFHDNNDFALISSKNDKCFYASIILIKDAKEILKTKCLPNNLIDFNALGSSNIHHNNKIFLSIGTPEQYNFDIAKLAQDDETIFGKIIELDKNELDKIIKKEKNNLYPIIFSKGHRNPQGLTKIDDIFFSVEHGPRGGDELNRIIRGKNYGWPKVSYGTKYLYDQNKKSYEMNHEINGFEEPLFALVPSVGISALNVCPKILKNYYKKNCLVALSLYGNNIRPGKSIIIYLLNEKMDKIHSIEKIFLRDDLKLRHFVTNSKNELYEDENGNIYISSDKQGIYKISFVDFINTKDRDKLKKSFN